MKIVNKPIALICAVAIFVGLQIILSHWVNPKWVLVFVNGNGYPRVLSGVFILVSGITLLLTTLERRTWFFLAQALCGYFLCSCCALILLSIHYGSAPSLDQMFDELLTFTSYVPPVPMRPYSVYLWFLMGVIFIMSSKPITKTSFVLLQVFTFIIMLCTVVGCINYLSAFELIYGGKDKFMMNTYAATGLSLVVIACFKTWGQYPDYLLRYAGREDLKFLTFGSILLTYISVSAALIGFSVVGQQSESFLKHSIENSLNLRGEVFKNTLKDELENIKSLIGDEGLHKAFRDQEKEGTQKRLEELMKNHHITSWTLMNEKGEKIFAHGEQTNDSSVSLGLSIPKTSLVWANKWFFHAERSILEGNIKIGTLIIEKPLLIFDYLSKFRVGVAQTEKSILCTIIDPAHARCFESANSDRSFSILSLLSDDGENPLIRAFQGFSGVMVSKVIRDKPMITAYMPMTELGLVATLNIEVDEIYDSMYRKLKIIIPFVLFCLVSAIMMFGWHVVPLIRKMVRTEREMAKSAAMLLESEITMRSILNNIGEAIITFDESGRVETINAVAEEAFGWNAQETIGRNVGTLIYAGGEDASQRMLETFALERRWNEVIAIRNNGSFFSAEFYLSEVFINQRKIYVGILLDITERKRSEQRLQESENRFRLSFDFAPIGMALLSIDGHWMRVNQALSNIVGFSENELLNRGMLQLVHGNDYENSKRILDSLLSGDIKTTHIEQRFIHKSGRVVWVYFNVFMLTDDDDKPLYIIAQIQDITERKVVEEELRGANEQLKERFTELEHHNRESILMTEMSRILQSCHTSDEASDPIESYCGQLMPNNSGALYLIKQGDTYMEQVAAWGSPAATNPVFGKQDCWALRRGQIHQVDALHSHIVCGHAESYKSQISGHLCIPLMAQGETLGLLYIELPGKAGDAVVIPESLRVLGTILGDHIALALSNIRLRETLQHQSVHDALTGLYNRRYLEEFMRLEFMRASRKSSSLAILILDVDHFKKFNDTYGHDAGDYVLEEVANVLTINVRDSDIACRWGGEEFVLLMPEANPEIAVQRAEAIRMQIKALRLMHGGHSLGELTISIGVALYPDHGETSDIIMEFADRALYEAKRNGRDQVVLAAYERKST